MSSSTLINLIVVAIFLRLSNATKSDSIDFRPVKYKDLDSATNTFVSAFDPGEMWTYLYQFRDRFPDYHWRCFREELETEYPRLHPTTYANVLVPLWEGNTEVQSFAVWKNMTRGQKTPAEGISTQSFGWPLPDDLSINRSNSDLESTESLRLDTISGHQIALAPGQPGADELKLPCSLHLDMNLVRLAHLAPQLQAAEKKYVEEAYEHQLYLSLLATHPDWDGNGFGAMQVEWGMERVRAESKWLSLVHGREINVPLTLLATPTGYPLYKSLGFESVANITFNFIDSFQGSTTWFEYMRWFSDVSI